MPTVGRVAYPDTVVGTDSHTTMVNGLGVLGYGVGGIEAEAVLLGQPLYQPMPHVVGVRLHGALPRGSTATDLVLVVTELLRAHGVVGSFVEFAGDGLATLALADRTTISNMSPEFGATSTLFPIDDETLTYLRLTGRSAERVELVERYARTQGLWREPGAGPVFDELLELDLASVTPSVAGPRRPQDRVPLEALRANFRSNFPNGLEGTITRARRRGARPGQRARRGIVGRVVPGVGSAVVHRRATPTSRRAPPADPVVADAAPVDRQAYRPVAIEMGGQTVSVRTGSVAIAAITSCTNTSNPTVMVGAGLLARNAVARGLRVGPTVKTSLAPGSRVVTSLSRGGRADGAARGARASRWPATAARRASATPDRSTTRSPGPSRRTTWSSPRSSRATATSRAGSTRSRARATSPRRRWSSPSRWPAGSTST